MKDNPIIKIVNFHVIDYPTPSNLNYWWNFGFLSAFCLGIQIVTGILLAMNYTPHVDLAMASVEHIMRDIDYGWLIRYAHANGASMFSIMVYTHMGRGLYYGSYMSPKELPWCVGVVIFILMMATAFMGYVLPWGQMSFWGATVITNLSSVIPVYGPNIVTWLWGAFNVGNATSNRFFSLHYLLPFIIAGASLIHLAYIHKDGSNNPLGVNGNIDKIPFYPYFYIKDLYSTVLFTIGFSFFVFFVPNLLNHPDNYIEANPLVTPPHIVPEWYFLPFYAILRSIPHKTGGVIAMGAALLVLLLIPFINTSEIRSSRFRPVYKKFYWLFIVDSLILGWIGGKPVEYPYIIIGQIATLIYFIFFLVIIPFLGTFEKWLIKLWLKSERFSTNNTLYTSGANNL
jgi:quinol-cytochrome oxidoreductase complex cytochrome b subunit